jgi:hypothetical protein
MQFELSARDLDATRLAAALRPLGKSMKSECTFPQQRKKQKSECTFPQLETIRLHLQRQHALGSDRFRCAIETQLGRIGMEAEPRVLARIGHHRSADGVELDVAVTLKQVRIAVDRTCLVSALP